MSQPAHNPTPTNTPVASLPADVNAEILLLGRILALGQDTKNERRGNEAYQQAQTLAVSDFSVKAHGYIWRAMQKVHEAGGAINITSIEGAFLAARVDIKQQVLLDLMIHTKGNVKDCKTRIAHAALRRKGLAMLPRLEKILTDGTLTPEQTGDHVSDETTRFLSIVQSLSDRRNVTLFDDLDAHEQTFEANRIAMSSGNMKVFGIPSGWASLDEQMGMNGWKRNTVTLVAGRPGTGKTSFLLNIGLRCLMEDARVTFVPLEMTHAEMTNRLIGIESGLDTIDLATGNVHPDDLKLLAEVRRRMKAREVSQKFIYLDLPPQPTMPLIESRLREHISTVGTDIIIFDQASLQCLKRVNPRQDDGSFMSEIVSTLKAWVHPKAFNVPLVAGAQVNRAGAQQQSKGSGTEYLANSDTLGQTADMVITLIRDKTETLFDGISPTTLDISKHRSGREGRLNWLYHTSSTRFEETPK